MELLDDLKARLDGEDSMFRAQLIREDIARLERLIALAGECSDYAAFQRAGLYIGWTQNDLLTHRIQEPLERLLAALYAQLSGAIDQDGEEALRIAWRELETARLERLIKCL